MEEVSPLFKGYSQCILRPVNRADYGLEFFLHKVTFFKPYIKLCTKIRTFLHVDVVKFQRMIYTYTQFNSRQLFLSGQFNILLFFNYQYLQSIKSLIFVV